MRVPFIIVVDAVEELGTLDSYLASFGYAESFTDKILSAIYERLYLRSEAMVELEDYLDRVLHEEYQYGEVLVPCIRKLYEACYHQLLDKQIYRADGKFPYVYESRMGNRTILFAYYAE